MTVLIRGQVVSVRNAAKVTRVIVAGSGRTNDLLMCSPKVGEGIKVGATIERTVRPAIERNRDNRVTGFITYWDDESEFEKRPHAPAEPAA